MAHSDPDVEVLVRERLARANDMLKTHVPDHDSWKIRIDRAKTRAGRCSYRTKTISFSMHFISDKQTTDDEFKNTVLHEIAHVLAGAKAKHGAAWRKVAKSIGCDGKRCLGRPITPRTRVARCECGSVEIRRHVITKKLLAKSCKKCKTKLREVANKAPAP